VTVFAAIVLHSLLDLPAVLMQISVLSSLIIVEIIIFVLAIALVIISYQAYKKFAKTDIGVINDVK
jgi:uncharacterized membrane protein YhfC